jgi:hypothetical protein
MKRAALFTFALLGLLVTGSSCDEAGDESARSTCDLAGTWALTEERVEGSCQDPARAAVGGRIRIEDQGPSYQMGYSAPGMTAMRCSGTPQEDPCLLELTCWGTESGAEVAFEIEVDPEGDELAGLRRLQLRDPPCQMTFDVTGRRVEDEGAAAPSTQ